MPRAFTTTPNALSTTTSCKGARGGAGWGGVGRGGGREGGVGEGGGREGVGRGRERRLVGKMPTCLIGLLLECIEDAINELLLKT